MSKSKQNSKQVSKKPKVGEGEAEEIKQAFDLFDTNQTGLIDPKEIKSAMQSLGYDNKQPVIFSIIDSLDTVENNTNGVDFEKFQEAIRGKMGDKNSREGIEKIYNLFIDDPEQKTFTPTSLRKLTKDLNIDMSPEEIKSLVERASKNGTELSFDEFYEIMIRQLNN